MKHARVGVGVAAIIAAAGLGFEALAQGQTRAECEANALRAYNAGLQRCSQKPFFEYLGCRMFEHHLYSEQMAYCAELPTTPRGGKAPPVSTSAPGGLDGWFWWS